MDREVEVSRMLLWFRAQLPPHELDEWFVTSMPFPAPVIVEDTDTSLGMRHYGRSPASRRVEGYGRCSRCGEQFPFPDMGNAIAYDESTVGRTVERLKDWVRRDAERNGPCWGDVPRVPRESGCAVLDC